MTSVMKASDYIVKEAGKRREMLENMSKEMKVNDKKNMF